MLHFNIFVVLGIKIVDLSLGASHGIALSSEGVLFVWGTHERTQISNPVPQPVKAFNPSFKANGMFKTFKSSKYYLHINIFLSTLR